MSRTSVRVDRRARIEGRGSIVASLSEGRVEHAAAQVVEALQLSEVALTDQPFDEVALLASLMCDTCAVSHSCASLRATEAALGISVSEETTLLRRLAMNAEVMSSHALHVYFLAAPKFLIADGLIPLVPENRALLKRAFRLKKTAAELRDLVGGRHTVPNSLVPGGFAEPPTMAQLGQMEKRLVDLRDDVQYAVDLYRSFEVPSLERPTRYVCLRQPDHYGFYGGELISSGGRGSPAERYVQVARDHVVRYSTGARPRWRQRHHMVGPLARVNNKWDQLCAEAQDVANVLGLAPPCFNPFMNTVAQVVELVHCLESSIELIDQILSYGAADQRRRVVATRGRRALGMVDAPRGLLVHDYTYDDEGRTAKVTILTPTAQNLGNIDADMRAYRASLNGETQDEMLQRARTLVRAYDPCASCSAPDVVGSGGTG